MNSALEKELTKIKEANLRIEKMSSLAASSDLFGGHSLLDLAIASEGFVTLQGVSVYELPLSKAHDIAKEFDLTVYRSEGTSHALVTTRSAVHRKFGSIQRRVKEAGGVCAQIAPF